MDVHISTLLVYNMLLASVKRWRVRASSFIHINGLMEEYII